MLLVELFEDANKDTARSEIADQYLKNASGHLWKMMKAGEALPTAVYQGKNLPCLPAEEFDCPPLFRKVLMIFKPSDYAMAGKAIMLKEPVGGYRFLLIVEVDGETTQDVWKSLRYDRVQDIIRHELQHITDFRRWQGKDIFQARGVDPSADSQHKSPQAYHNDDLELNAFFHNLAEPLLNRIRFLRKHGLEAAGLFDPIPRDFREWLAQRAASLHGLVKRHWQSLREANKRRAIARLKNLFDLYWKEVDDLTSRSDAPTA